MVHVDREEIALLAATQTNVTHWRGASRRHRHEPARIVPRK
jgi:hypothetical protein